MKGHMKNKGFTLIEILIVLGIILTISIPIIKIVYGNELREFDSKIFNLLGIKGIWRFVILGVLGSIALYLKFKPIYKESKEIGHFKIGTPVKYFSLLSLIIIIVSLSIMAILN